MYILNVSLGVQISIFCKLCKNPEKSWKHGNFEFPALKLVYYSKWTFAKKWFD